MPAMSAQFARYSSVPKMLGQSRRYTRSLTVRIMPKVGAPELGHDHQGGGLHVDAQHAVLGVAPHLAGELAVGGVGAPDAAGVRGALAGLGGLDQRARGWPVGPGRVLRRLVVIRDAFFPQGAGRDHVVAHFNARLQGAGGARDKESARAQRHQLFQGHGGARGAHGHVHHAHRMAIQRAHAQSRTHVRIHRLLTPSER